MAQLLYQGHGSYRIVARDGTVIYVDPYAGEGYDLPADLVLVTHQHYDHNKLELLTLKPDSRIITEREALMGGVHREFDFRGVHIRAVTAGNRNHNPAECVGYVLSLDGISLYGSGDTSKTAEMESLLPALKLDYALLCIDGVYNMDPAEASGCARLIGAKTTIPVHMKEGRLFDQAQADLFDCPGKRVLKPGETMDL